MGRPWTILCRHPLDPVVAQHRSFFPGPLGKRLTVAEEHTRQYVIATIRVRAKQLTVMTMDGEIIHDGAFAWSRSLR